MGGFRVGWSKVDITPIGGKVVIAGMVPWRRTQQVHDPICATVLVIESNECRTIFVSCDFCHPTKRLRQEVCDVLRDTLCGFSDDQLIINGTHATACFYMTDDEFLHLPGNNADCAKMEDIIPLPELRRQICTQIANAVRSAADNLEETEIASGSADILTGFCRRVIYRDGTAEMYGDPHREDFCCLEYPDGGPTQMIYFYRKSDHALTGVIANVPCPSQADESSEYLTADYWGVVREELENTYGREIFVLATCRAAGELSPHRLMRSPDHDTTEEWGRASAERLGRWIAEHLVMEEQKINKDALDGTIVHHHITKEYAFPVRLPDQTDYDKARCYMNDRESFGEDGCALSWMDFSESSHVIRMWEEKPNEYRTFVSAVQLGNNLIFTAPVELFAEYAARVSMQFREYRMFDIQLAQDYMGYLPTEKAIQHGGYSTYHFSTVSGPEGGEYYVKETINLLRQLLI